MGRTVYVVTRHENVRKWVNWNYLPDNFPTVQVEHIDDAFITQLRYGDAVVGIIPIHLAARICKKTQNPVYILSLPDIAPELRGKELTLEQMDAAGARLDGFKVEEDPIPLVDRVT